ncbi:hypothetical protein LTR37_014581 [Vermiconidia calcicola]|uniref:Uncharacterized protein n=1 Tax=Vermiconidia calcicola TaxID=1690605 RepID=A0ACC3MT93_9PEZI|nr:hypothetical protein LTR37_014581 [Vermiconidia calcicola]
MAQPDAKRQKIDSPSEPDTKRQKIESPSDCFTVFVGPEQKQYTLDKGFATETSEYLTTATKEGRDKIYLPDFEPHTFEAYTHWLYVGEITAEEHDNIDFKEPVVDSDTIVPRPHTPFGEFMDLYLLGEFLLDKALKNIATDWTVGFSVATNIYPGIAAIERIWKRTPEGCAMQRLLVRFWARYMQDNQMEVSTIRELRGFAVALINDLIFVRDRGVRASAPTMKHRCDYHDHDRKVPEEPHCWRRSNIELVTTERSRKSLTTGIPPLRLP